MDEGEMDEVRMKTPQLLQKTSDPSPRPKNSAKVANSLRYMQILLIILFTIILCRVFAPLFLPTRKPKKVTKRNEGQQTRTEKE